MCACPELIRPVSGMVLLHHPKRSDKPRLRFSLEGQLLFDLVLLDVDSGAPRPKEEQSCRNVAEFGKLAADLAPAVNQAVGQPRHIAFGFQAVGTIRR